MNRFDTGKILCGYESAPQISGNGNFVIYSGSQKPYSHSTTSTQGFFRSTLGSSGYDPVNAKGLEFSFEQNGSLRLGTIIKGEAHRFAADTELWDRITAAHRVEPLACVLVDEAQFLAPTQVWQLARVADEAGIPVLCYGLRTDFQGELFPGSAVLLGIADALVELKAVCDCGRKATMNLRVDESGAAVKEGAQTEIGGNDRYVALCRKHFSEALG